MPTNAKSTSTSRNTSSTAAKSVPKSTGRRDTSQVREGVTKARHGAISIVRESAERAVDIPVGAALTVRDRVTEAVEPWASSTARERELNGLRTQVTRELNRFERRGGQARRKAKQRVRTSRTRVEREVKARRREAERAVKQNRTKVEKAVKENRVRFEEQLKKAQSVVQERVSSPSAA